MAFTVKLNHAGIRQVLQSSEVAAELQARAEKVAAAAQASAPRQSGEYANSIEVVMDQHSDRAVAHVVAKAPYSLLVEANTGNLARALDAASG